MAKVINIAVEYLLFQFSKPDILTWFAKVQLSFSVVKIQNSALSMEGFSSDNIFYNIEKPIFYENHAYCTTLFPDPCYMYNDICKEI
jgi:hypothetical protein